jgi:hypothetical protein
MSPTMNKHLKTALMEAIHSDPRIVPEVLECVQDGMEGWRRDVFNHLDLVADRAIGAAMFLPPDHTTWDVREGGQRAAARLVAIGYGLIRREASSAMEKWLVAFVRKADTLFPDKAAAHYRTLKTQPIPPLTTEET